MDDILKRAIEHQRLELGLEYSYVGVIDYPNTICKYAFGIKDEHGEWTTAPRFYTIEYLIDKYNEYVFGIFNRKFKEAPCKEH